MVRNITPPFPRPHASSDPLFRLSGHLTHDRLKSQPALLTPPTPPPPGASTHGVACGTAPGLGPPQPPGLPSLHSRTPQSEFFLSMKPLGFKAPAHPACHEHPMTSCDQKETGVWCAAGAAVSSGRRQSDPGLFPDRLGTSHTGEEMAGGPQPGPGSC